MQYNCINVIILIRIINNLINLTNSCEDSSAEIERGPEVPQSFLGVYIVYLITLFAVKFLKAIPLFLRER